MPRTVGGRAAPGGPTRPAAVLFDFNGTLSDDEPLLLRIFSELFAAHLGWQMTAEEYFARLAGHSDREIVETAVAECAGGDPSLVTDLLDARRRRYRELVAEAPTIHPRTRALVDVLTCLGVPLGVVTGAQRPDVEVGLAAADLTGYFGVVVTEEDVRHGKPHPEGFVAAADALGLCRRLDRVVVVEDSVAGIRAAKAAGMRCLAVTGTTAPDLLAREADAVVASLDVAVLPLLGLDPRPPVADPA
jgi:beta-phosphoglucomutase